MALRWRKSGNLVCAAKTEEMPGDAYIDDRLHYQLSEVLGVIEPTAEEETTGLWKWSENSGFSCGAFRQIYSHIEHIVSQPRPDFQHDSLVALREMYLRDEGRVQLAREIADIICGRANKKC